jgi:hypothetical protein
MINTAAKGAESRNAVCGILQSVFSSVADVIRCVSQCAFAIVSFDGCLWISI